MDDACATGKRAKEPNHKIDGMVRRENAEVTHTGPEGIERRERNALLEIIFVRHHAALWAATGSGGVDDAGDVFSFARHENRFNLATEFFPPLRSGEISVRWGLGDKDQLYIFDCGAFRRNT